MGPKAERDAAERAEWGMPVVPPVAPMLARSVKGISALDGQEVSFEPKWDGFRSIVFRSGDRVEIGSRNEKPMTRYFPEIVEASLDADGAPSCSALEALERQEPFVNQVLAYHALALLTRLFRYGRVEHHGAFVSVRENRVHPIKIDPELWRRMRRRGRRVTVALAA